MYLQAWNGSACYIGTRIHPLDDDDDWVDAGSEDYEFTLDALVTFYFLVLGLMVWTYGASASTRTLDWSAFVCLSLCAHVCFSSVLT